MTKALITIHGYLTDDKDFDRLYDYLGYYDEVIRFLAPGHKDKNYKEFNVEDTLDGLNKLFDEVSSRFDQVDVAGYSMGGALATYLCATKKVNKAVLFAPANKYFNIVNSSLQFEKFCFDAYKRIYKSAEGDFFKKTFKATAEVSKQRDERMKVGLDWMLHVFPHVPSTFKVFAKLIKTIDSTVDAVEKVDTPTLVLWGVLDELVPYSSIEYIGKKFENLTVKKLDNVDHMMLMTERDEVLIESAVEFLTGEKVIVSPRTKPRTSFKDRIVQ